MIDLFECRGEITSVGIIVDFSDDTETYIVGTPADIKAWAYAGCPQKVTKGLMRHNNKAGNLVKDINRLMKVKYELTEQETLTGIMFGNRKEMQRKTVLTVLQEQHRLSVR